MNTIQTIVERTILCSRYLLVVFYIGLAFALLIYAVSFVFEVLHVAQLALIASAVLLALLDGITSQTHTTPAHKDKH